ncbi:MAG: amidophosphoribosyltransferase [Fibrobacter sp.]|jgi:amidophosphoribosyltransferase|nr:amidophosphoribosyltransferase [Fibrobacter sp.]
MLEEIHEECGVIGIFNGENISRNITMGLYALQHRGQESAGIAVTSGDKIRTSKSMGLVSTLLHEHDIDSLEGFAGIGHVRYSTTGSRTLANAQPILVSCKWGQIAVVHNGNITNAPDLRNEMEANGHIFQTTSDAEVVLHEIARSQADTLQDAILLTISKFTGSFSMLILSNESMYAARDGFGFRPLALSRLGKSWCIASETCAFDLLGANYVREIHPGELLTITNTGLHSKIFVEKEQKAHCIFEYIYFSRPDSKIFGQICDKVRRKMGKQLAKECPVDADIVISVPDSSNTAALGYAQASGLRFEIGLLRNHYVGRTFIDPTQNIREQKVKLKFNPIEGVLKNKKVCVVEDSIVRGTTLKILSRMLRDAGALEVHIRIASPPVEHPCFFGMDFPSTGELAASSMTPKEIAKMLGVESLGYLSVEGMKACTGNEPQNYCSACFDGNYPDSIGNPNPSKPCIC